MTTMQRPIGWSLARQMFLLVGRLSEGIQVGAAYGFSSGEMLDYVYEDRPRGRGPFGRAVDRFYLDTPGWRGIRERRANLVRTLTAVVLARRALGQSTRVLDVAGGPGRYLLDLVESFRADDLHVECRDADPDALVLGRQLAAERGLGHAIEFTRHDALDARALASIRPRPDVVVVSGLYEILLDDAAICASLRGIAELLPPGGLLVLTGQPRHPQLALIANLLTHRDGSAWRMRLRSTATLTAWCAAAGFVDIHTQPDSQAIFSVSVMRKP